MARNVIFVLVAVFILDRISLTDELVDANVLYLLKKRPFSLVRRAHGKHESNAMDKSVALSPK